MKTTTSTAAAGAAVLADLRNALAGLADDTSAWAAAEAEGRESAEIATSAE